MGQIKKALTSDCRLDALVKIGLRALKAEDKDLIHEQIKSKFDESLNTDDAFSGQFPNSHRWDYLLSLNCQDSIIALEPHSAETKEVSVVIAKKEALMQQWKNETNALRLPAKS